MVCTFEENFHPIQVNREMTNAVTSTSIYRAPKRFWNLKISNASLDEGRQHQERDN